MIAEKAGTSQKDDASKPGQDKGDKSGKKPDVKSNNGVKILNTDKDKEIEFQYDCDGGDCACPQPQEGIVEQQQVSTTASSQIRPIRVIVSI